MSMDVLLIQPPIMKYKRFGFNLERSVPPLPLLYLAEPLIKKGFDVDILDLSAFDMNPRRFQDYIGISRPAVVGITCATITFSEALNTAKYIKSVDPGIKIVIGGPHVTFTAPETLANDCFDIVVRGEGEVAFSQLVEHYINGKYSLPGIRGISYRQDGEIKETPRKIITDIDTLSYPSRGRCNLSRYSIPGTMIISRGCPFRCHFCAAAALSGGKYRIRSISNILEEIDYLVTGLGISHLAFLDDTLTAYPEIVKTLCRHILGKGYRIKWLCESRVDVVEEELVRHMARAGCYGIQFGFESGSEEILQAMNKRITPWQIENAVEICLDAGILAMGNFLIGFPRETKETVKMTLELAKKLKRRGSNTNVGVMTPFPGTYYYNHARELGITIHAAGWDDYEIGHPVISTRNFSKDQLREILFDCWVELSH